MRAKYLCYLLVPTLVVSTGGVFAQGSFERLYPVQGDRLDRTEDEVGPNVKVFHGQDIDQTGRDKLYDVLPHAANVRANLATAVPAIRGIGSYIRNSQVLAAGGEPRVPVLIDGVATPFSNSPGLSNMSTWDLSSIEVIKGPAPVWGGRNAMGGAVKVHTNDPVFSNDVAVEMQNNRGNGWRAGAMLNAAYSDQIAVRVAASADNAEYFPELVANSVIITILQSTLNYNTDEYSAKNARAKIRLAPDFLDGLDMQFSYNKSEVKTPGYLTNVTAGYDFVNPYLQTIQGVTVTSHVAAGIPHQTEGYNESTLESYGFNSEYKFNNNLTWGLRAAQTKMEFIIPKLMFYGDFEVSRPEKQWETYLQFSDIGFIKRGVLGVARHSGEEETITDGESQFRQFHRFAQVGWLTRLAMALTVDGEFETKATYAEVEFGLDKHFDFIAGGRYEEDTRERNVRGTLIAFLGSRAIDNGLALSDAARNSIRHKATEKEFLPKLGMRVNIDDDNSVGFMHTRNYRPGGIDADIYDARSFPPQGEVFIGPAFLNTITISVVSSPADGATVATSEYDPEYIRNNELYFKSKLFGKRLKLDGAVFNYTFEDAQVRGASTVINDFVHATQTTLFFPNINAPTSTVTTTINVTLFRYPLVGNIPKAKAIGAELDFEYDFNEDIAFYGGVSYLDSEIVDASNTHLAGWEGNPLPEAPRWTGNFGVRYSSSNFDFDTNARFSSGARLGVPHFDDQYPLFWYYNVVDSQENYPKFGKHFVLDIASRYKFQAGGVDFELAGFVNNIFDRKYFIGRREKSVWIQNLGEFRTAGERRSMGVVFRADF